MRLGFLLLLLCGVLAGRLAPLCDRAAPAPAAQADPCAQSYVADTAPAANPLPLPSPALVSQPVGLQPHPPLVLWVGLDVGPRARAHAPQLAPPPPR